MEGNHYFIKPGKVNLYIHPPVYTDKLTKEEITELPEKVENILEVNFLITEDKKIHE